MVAKRLERSHGLKHLDGALDERLTGGELNAAVARRVVQITRDCFGRGPTKAHAFFRDTVLVVVLHETMTKGERTLAGAGRSEAVRDLRQRIHATMQPELVAAVEALTGCDVMACMSDCDADADVAVTVFVLDRQVPSANSRPAGAIDGAAT
jgi:uncharacterized protein YbcI